MRRRCDGTDPNLVRYVAAKGAIVDDGEPPRRRSLEVDGKPCDCGLVFDDVYRSTIFPHELV